MTRWHSLPETGRANHTLAGHWTAFPAIQMYCECPDAIRQSHSAFLYLGVPKVGTQGAHCSSLCTYGVQTFHSLHTLSLSLGSGVNMPALNRGYYDHATDIWTKALTRRVSILIVSGLVTIALLAWYTSVQETPSSKLHRNLGGLGRKGAFNGRWNYDRDADNLMLTSRQCDRAFPGLFEEAERPMNDRLQSPITVDELDSVPQQNGYVRAMIYNQQVCMHPSRHLWLLASLDCALLLTLL